MQDLPTNIWLFFGVVVSISLTGVLMPGPLLAATIAKGYKDKVAGIKIAIGHGLVEFPLMVLLILSVGLVFKEPAVKLAIGLVGGMLMMFLGTLMIRTRKKVAQEGADKIPYGSITTGALTTAVNPYFIFWWATIGLTLLNGAMEFGAIVVVMFAVVHWSCDFAWYSFTAFAVFKTKNLWTPLVHEIVFFLCGAVLFIFGIWVVVGPMLELLESL